MIKKIIFLTFFCLFLGYSSSVLAVEREGTLTSTNLLENIPGRVFIDSFWVNVSSLPSYTRLKVQFSKDGVNWVDSSGNSNSWEVIPQTGGYYINLSRLKWTENSFYYRMRFETDWHELTPLVDEVRLYYVDLYRGVLISKNLLEGKAVDSIQSFYYNAVSIPSGSLLRVQFSQDGTNWVNSSGTPNGWDVLTYTGGKEIDLRGLNWTTPYFYYKMEFYFNPQRSAAPVLEEVGVKYIEPTPCDDHNVFGWAWGGMPYFEGGELKAGSGWIGFSCCNYYSGLSQRISRCYLANYGVDINPSTFKFSGRAWSGGGEEEGSPKPVLGWLSFERTETGAPPSDDPCPDGTCIAKVGEINPSICDKNNNGYLDIQCGGKDNSTTPISNYKQVFGWARFCGIPQGQSSVVCGGGGWDGWIKFSHRSSNPNSNFGTVIDLTTNPKQFRGWAWGGDVVGWISFNCSNQNSCSNSNYFVATDITFNQPPSVSNLITSTPNYCTELSGIGQINLSWRYNDNDGDPQSQYQIQVQSSGGTMYVDCTIDATVATGTQESVAIRISQSPTSQLCDYPNYIGDVPYNTSLQWRVRVKDNKGAWSDWSSWVSFSTAHHPYPYVDFTWTPSRPVVGEAVQFTSLSQVFYGSPSYLWTFTNATPSSATTQNATTTFTSGGDQNATLRVTDSMGYYCEKTKAINVRRQPFYFPIPPVPPQ